MSYGKSNNSGCVDFDQYDMINAPQYLDFNDLAANNGLDESDDVDKFFETHKEEDDFFIPVENISPTIQLLDATNGNSVKEKIPTPATKTIVVANGNNDKSHGLTEYYDSLTQSTTKSVKSQKQAPVHSSLNTPEQEENVAEAVLSSVNSSMSYYTPAGGQENKENNVPCSNNSIDKEDDSKVKQPISNSPQRSSVSSTNSQNSGQYYLRQSLLAQLENKLDSLSFHVSDSSDEEIVEEKDDEDKPPVIWNVEPQQIIEEIQQQEQVQPQAITLKVLQASPVCEQQQEVVTKQEVPKPKLPSESEFDVVRKTARSTQRRSVDSSANSNRKIQPIVPRRSNSSQHNAKMDHTNNKDANNDFQFKARPVPKDRFCSPGVKERVSHVTKAQGPNFHTEDRIRERQEKRSKSQQSSPEPVKRRAPTPNTRAILIKPSVAVPIIPKKFEPTVPKPFKFSTYHTKPPQQDNNEEVIEYKFKARPVPIKLFQGPVGLKEKEVIPATKPHEPNFMSEVRIRERQEKKAQRIQESPILKRKPSPSPSRKPSRIPTPSKKTSSNESLGTQKVTIVQPFSFDARDKDSKHKFEEKIQQELEEEKKMREFHANPLPSFRSKLPLRKPVPATVVEPFHLKADERGEMYQEALRKKLEEEERHLQELRTFQAHPAYVIHAKPFEPQLSHEPLIEPMNFQLYTEKRAVKREEFDDMLKKREEEIAVLRRQQEALKVEEERLYDQELRRQLVHKALPLKRFHTFHVKSSSKALTDPKSPAFLPLPSQRHPKN